jgi:hypothetical protein
VAAVRSTPLIAIVCGLLGLSAIVFVATLYQKGGGVIPGFPGFVSPGPLSKSHAFLGNSCESCHTPVRGIEAATCKGCHANNSGLLSKKSTVFHANIPTCSGCHVEHQRGARLIGMDHEVLSEAGYAQAPVDRSPASQLVRFAASLGHQLQDKNVQRLDCANCHANRDPHRALFGSECGACHAVTNWKISSYRHPSPNSQDCAQCHQAPPSHYMMHFEMVSKPVARQEHASVSQCQQCHQTDAWNNIRGVGWYKHH